MTTTQALKQIRAHNRYLPMSNSPLCSCSKCLIARETLR